MRPLTRRLDHVAERLLVTNRQLAETNRTPLATRALLDGADRRLAEMQRLLASTDKGVAGTGRAARRTSSSPISGRRSEREVALPGDARVRLVGRDVDGDAVRLRGGALVWTKYPSWTAKRVRDRLLQRTTPLATMRGNEWMPSYDSGLLNLQAALR